MIGIFAGGFVGKGLVDLDAIELPLGVLIQCANANIPDTLSVHRDFPDVSG